MTNEELKKKSFNHVWHFYVERDCLGGGKYWHSVWSFDSLDKAISYAKKYHKNYCASSAWKVSEENYWLENHPVVNGEYRSVTETLATITSND